jgi:4-hydroxy-tetrahydrodipicolinate synthase
LRAVEEENMDAERLRNSLKGVMVTSVTPFRRDLSVDEEGIRANVRFLIQNGIDVLTPCGSIGEWSSLTTDEIRTVISVTVDEAGGRAPVLAGVSSTSTIEAAKRAKIAESVGADAVLAVPAFYVKYTMEGLLNHFKMIGESTTLPIVLYNAPDFLGFELSTDELVKVTEHVESVVAIKDATTDMLEFSNRIRIFKDREVRELLGNEPYCYHGLVAGSPGTFNSVGNFAPGPLKRMYHAIVGENITEAKETYMKLTRYFAFRRKTRNPIAVVKQSMAESGLGIQPVVRPPLSELRQEEKDELRTILRELKSALSS